MDQGNSLLGRDGTARLREALTERGYTLDGLRDRLGDDLADLLEDGDSVPALRALADDPLATLIRVFRDGRTVRPELLAAALAPLTVDEALAGGLVERHGDGLRGAVAIEVYGPWWLLADHVTPSRPMRAEHVLGVTGSSLTLADYTARTPVDSALDLGIGGGLQALHLSQHAARVTGTDLLPRALTLAATTAALNGQDWELLLGDLAAPVAGRRFDLVVANPPFVIRPGEPTFAYRDAGRQGDGVAAELIAAAPGLLTDGGLLQFEGDWAHRADEPWAERLAGWATAAGLDAWIVQGHVHSPRDYVEHWADAGRDDADTWLDWLHAERVEALGWGVVTLRNAGAADPVVRVESRAEFPRHGADVLGWFARQDWLRAHAADLLGQHYAAAPELELRTLSVRPGPDGWQPVEYRLATAGGPTETPVEEPVSALVAAALGAIDPARPLGAQAPELLAELPELVERGFLLPVGLA